MESQGTRAACVAWGPPIPDDQLFVFRLGDERRVERVKVESLLEDVENIEPGGDLVEGDLIVAAGQASLKDGALVRLPGDPDPADDEDDEQEKEADGDSTNEADE